MNNSYCNPFMTRYGSNEMRLIFSPQTKYSIWRQLWLCLAQTQYDLGLNIITNEALECMKNHLEDIDFDLVSQIENKIHHDVMAHIQAWGIQNPIISPIIHLGATSCFVTDNGDIIIYRKSLNLIQNKLIKLMKSLSIKAIKYKNLPCLGYTHLQPAQLTTMGKRICLWLHDLSRDYKFIKQLIDDMPFRGVKGTTGTQASFLELFNGDDKKVVLLDKLVSNRMGFSNSLPICGQTYTRKIDSDIIYGLCSIAQSLHKMATDIRLLSSMKEIDEPFDTQQVGSSAMAYKRNPIKCENICGLTRHVCTLLTNSINTACNQWCERTLDDSANKRITMPEAFLAIDSCLDTSKNIIDGLIVWPNVITKNVLQELPFIATENILMECVKLGHDRQEIHEKLRKHSFISAQRVKENGVNNDLLIQLKSDPIFKEILNNMPELLDSNIYIGRSIKQVEEFIINFINPILRNYSSAIEMDE